jgi:hypothetical protein
MLPEVLRSALLSPRFPSVITMSARGHVFTIQLQGMSVAVFVTDCY